MPEHRLQIGGQRYDFDFDSGADIEEQLRRILRDPASPFCHVVTLNPEYVMQAHHDARFASALRRATLTVPDGAGIVLAARWLQGDRLTRCTGRQLLPVLARLSRAEQAPLFLLGGRGEVPDLAGAALERDFQARIAGAWSGGSPQPADDDRTVERIAGSGARIVAVAYGAPAQVLWIDRNADRLRRAGVRVAIGVGGTFDVLAGTAPVPPAIVSTFGLEWLYRLVREPWRWRRQLALPAFVLLAVKEWLAGSTRTRR